MLPFFCIYFKFASTSVYQLYNSLVFLGFNSLHYLFVCIAVLIQVQILFSVQVVHMRHQEAKHVCSVLRVLSVQHQDWQHMFLVLMEPIFTQTPSIKAAARAVQLVIGVQIQGKHQRAVLMGRTVKEGQLPVLCVQRAISEYLSAFENK